MEKAIIEPLEAISQYFALCSVVLRPNIRLEIIEFPNQFSLARNCRTKGALPVLPDS
jgi:hypothetical protein